MKSHFQNCVIKSSGTSNGYHTGNEVEKRGQPDFVASSGMLREFQSCNSRWREGYEHDGSDAMNFGSLVDCMLMTPDEFDLKFKVKPPLYENKKGDMVWSGSSKVCGEWRAGVEAAGYTVIGQEELDEANAALLRLRRDPIICEWADTSDKQVWLTGEWVDEDTELVIPVKALLDFVPRLDSPYYKCLGDMKCIRNAATEPFTRQVHQNGWHFQAAFYTDFYVAATGQDRCAWVFVGVENYKPFEPYRKILAGDFIDIGRRAYRAALRDYARCLKTGKWGGYDDLPKNHPLACGGFTALWPTPWMEFSDTSGQIQADYEEELEKTRQASEDSDMPPM